MARQQANVEYNQFQSGLITEGNLLNLPVDCFREGENFVLTKGNFWERRKGLGLEASGEMLPSYSELSDQTTVTSVSLWQTHTSALPEILVIQIGEKLHFFDSTVDPLSDGKLLVNGQEYLTTSGATKDRISGTSVEGMFLYAIEDSNPIVLQLTEVTQDVLSPRKNLVVRDEVLRLQTRDVWGRRTPSKTRPSVIDSDTRYDLNNQGWDATKIEAARAALGVYPSDYDVWWLYKLASSSDPDKIGKFDPNRMKNNDSTGFGQERQNTPAPRGSTVTDLNIVASGKPRTIQTYAGRVFYAGFTSTPRTMDDVKPDFSNHVFFSQVVKANADLYKCFSFADPTSETDSDLVDTDGGFIKINSARNIIAMREVSSGLVVIAENGVWMISGTTEGLFSATGYQVDKVTDYGCISVDSIATFGDNVFFFAEEGIIALAPDQTTGKHVAQNLSEERIQSLYDGISASNRKAAVATVQRSDKYIRWMVSEGASPNYFDLEIIFSLNLGAFFINRFKSNITVRERVLGYIPERSVVKNLVSSDYFVVAGTSRVVVDSADVTVPLARRVTDDEYKDTKYLVADTSGNGFGFYQYNNESFQDFGLVDAKAFLISSPQKLEDTQRRKQIVNLATHMLRTDVMFMDSAGNVTTFNSSSMKLRVRWDYASSTLSNKWSKERQCYRYRRPLNLKQGNNVYPFEVITARERVRGSGTSFQFEFTTEPTQDCKLLGWAVSVTGGTKV